MLVLLGLPPVDLVARELALRWQIQETNNPGKTEQETGLRDVIIEKRALNTDQHPASTRKIKYVIDDEEVSPYRFYRDASKIPRGVGAAYVAYAQGRQLDNKKVRELVAI